MISPELLARLRCPLSPSRAKMQDAGDALVCECCQVRFPIREGIPCLLPEEAELPAGCSSLEALPCKRQQGEGQSPSP